MRLRRRQRLDLIISGTFIDRLRTGGSHLWGGWVTHGCQRKVRIREEQGVQGRIVDKIGAFDGTDFEREIEQGALVGREKPCMLLVGRGGGVFI